MSTREEFEKRLHIAYLDEVTVYSFKDSIFHAVVSMNMKKDTYINNLEKDWAELRRKYDIPDGVCLHFTDIKALLNPQYFLRQPKERNADMERIFCDTGNKLVPDKLFDFYCDILDIIHKNNFTVQVTGKRYQKTPLFTNKKMKNYNNGFWYPLFREHLDSMAYYFIKSAYEEYEAEVMVNKNAKYHNYTVKLRYDGDIELTVRNDFRNAFSHSISNGTKRFTFDAFKEIFDEVRFIDKSEIGFCTVCPSTCNSRQISHAGSEIVDFMAVYVARYIAYKAMKNDLIRYEEKSEEEAEKIINRNMHIEIQGKPLIKPIDRILPKIFFETTDH